MVQSPSRLTELDESIFGGLTEEDLRFAEGMAERAQQSARQAVDPDAVAFRRLSLIKGPIFNICHRDEDGKSTNIVEIPGVDVVGLSGVIIKYGAGFGLFHEPEGRYTCQTSGSVLPNGTVIRNNLPLSRPLYNPVKYNEDRTIIEPIPELLNYDLSGTVNGKCHDCVLSKKNMIEVEGKQPSRCGSLSSLIFCVMKVLVRSQKLGPNKKPVFDYKWENVVDLTHTDGSTIYESPFILNISPGNSVSLKRVGKKLMMKNQPLGPSVEGCVGLDQLLEELQKQPHIYRTAKRNFDGQVYQTYLTPIEIYAGQPETEGVTNQMVHCMPVYREADVEDPMVWVNTAHQVYNREIQEHVNNTLGIQTVTALNSTSTAGSLEPSTSELEEEGDEDKSFVGTTTIEDSFI